MLNFARGLDALAQAFRQRREYELQAGRAQRETELQPYRLRQMDLESQRAMEQLAEERRKSEEYGQSSGALERILGAQERGYQGGIERSARGIEDLVAKPPTAALGLDVADRLDTAPTPVWKPEDATALRFATDIPQRPTTIPDLVRAGALPRDFELTAQHRPKVLELLGLQTPESAEFGRLKTGAARRAESSAQQIDALKAEAMQLDPATDYPRVKAIAQQIALAEGRIQDFARLKQPITPEELTAAVQAMGGASTSGRVRTRLDSEGKFSIENEPTTAAEERIKAALIAKGYRAGTPEYDLQFWNQMKLVPTQKEGDITGGAELIPAPGGAPAGTSGALLKTGQPKPISESGAMAIASGNLMERTLARIDTLLSSPTVDQDELNQYIGPYAQYKSQTQRYAPEAMLGPVPKSVVILEQSIAQFNTFMLRLLSGSQITLWEQERIKKGLPGLHMQRGELETRLELTREDMRFLIGRIQELALHGDQKALSTAQELGIPIGNGGPAPAGPAAPAAKALPPGVTVVPEAGGAAPAAPPNESLGPAFMPRPGVGADQRLRDKARQKAIEGR